MPRPSLRHALAVLTAMLATSVLVLPLVASGAAAAAAGTTPSAPPAATDDPLVVHLDAITPVTPEEGSVEVTGTVTNASDEVWTRVNLHVFSSTSPITDPTSLAASATIDPEEYVGPRVTVPGTFDTVEVLEPGQSAVFSMSVPVELLGIGNAEGVYWIGVHALGDSSVPRDDFADGRARTFIPTLTERPVPEVSAALVLPLRGKVRHRGNGSLAGVRRWTRLLSAGGRFSEALDIMDVTAATPAELTVLVDPAVLSAVARLSVGNPPRSLAPDPTVPGQEPTQEQPGENPEGEGTEPPTEDSSPSPVPTPGTPEDERTETEQAAAAAATAWLDRFRALAATRPVLALPFGDLDVSAAVRHDSSRFTQALERSQETMAALGIEARAAVVPPDGVLSPEAVAATPADVAILLGDTAFAVPPTTESSMVRLLDHEVLVTSTGAAAGGPGPTRANDPLAMRQRLLSEAALRATASSTAPIVLTLPERWTADDVLTYVGAFDRRWLSSATVPELTGSSGEAVSTSLAYTEEDAAAELGADAFAAARQLTDAAALTESVLTLETTVERQVADEALVALSVRYRTGSPDAVDDLHRLEDALRDDLAGIRVEAPTSVLLAGATGPLGATLVNELDQPVTVRLEPRSDSDLRVSGRELHELAPGSRTPLRYEVTASSTGVHDLRLVVTSESGVPLGSAARLPVRTAQVGAFIWFVIGGGAALLVGAVLLRVVRRVRAARQPTGTTATEAA